MSLTIVRGPLEAWKNEVILTQYNRLASSRIPMREFLHWVQDGVEGPAWHAVLENEESEIVGHCAIIPFRGVYNGRKIVAGKAEYAFIIEDYQAAKIRGIEQSGKPRNAIMIQRLFQSWQGEGLGPLMISTSAMGQRLLSSVGCSLVKFPVSECLLILRPWNAARVTPNLQGWQRASLGVAGILQNAAWSTMCLLPRSSNAIRAVRDGESLLREENNQVCFFEDSESSKWRYLEGQYERLSLDSGGGQYVIVKKGAKDRYLRVCQWGLAPGQPSFQLITKLVEMAQEENALGVRWAVYGSDEAATALARRLRTFGFLCGQRTRALLLYSKEQDFLTADKWKFTDAMFSFDP